MAKPFPDMDYWGFFAAMGPVPQGKAGEPPAYGLDPMASGPYKVKSFTPNEEVVLERNENWDPETDPARHQFVDEWVLKFDQNPETTDALMISNNEESKTSIDTIVSGTAYQETVDASVTGSSSSRRPAPPSWRSTTRRWTTSTCVGAVAFAYDYENIWAAGGDIPGTTRVMGTSIIPPGMGGYDPEMEPIPGEKIEFNPEKAKEYLEKAGIEPGTYTLSYAYDASSQQGKDAGRRRSGASRSPASWPRRTRTARVRCTTSGPTRTTTSTRS